MIKRLIIYKAVRYPEYCKEVYEDVSDAEADRTMKQLYKDLSEHRIADYQVEVAE